MHRRVNYIDDTTITPALNNALAIDNDTLPTVANTTMLKIHANVVLFKILIILKPP